MKILNAPIDTLSFQDIVDLCKDGIVEGIQLEYKRELPPKGLAKHFASFSNTRGGLLVIGVEEDTKTGKPTRWEGVADDSKLIDKIHQYASNVDPRPAYEVCATDAQNGKVFILVRIFEGDRTPYYVQNDASLYIRTGNITDPIDLASPEAVELLFGKKIKAEIARNNYIKRSDEIFKAAKNRADKQRLQAIANEKENWEKNHGQGVQQKFESNYSRGELGVNAALCTTLLQPFYPGKPLTSPQEILVNADQIRTGNYNIGQFPDQDLQPIQDGIMSFRWWPDGDIQCHQIYANGLLFNSSVVMDTDKKGERTLWLSRVAFNLLFTLKACANFYKLFSYQGGIIGFLHLDQVEDATIYQIHPQGYQYSPLHPKRVSFLSSYRWEIEMETALLFTPKNTQSYFIEKIKEIYWTLGIPNVQTELIEKFLKDNGLFVE